MKFLIHAGPKKHKEADLLVIPFIKHKNKVELAHEDKHWAEPLQMLLAVGDFKGKEGEVIYLYPQSFSEKRIALLGLGDANKITTETLRRAFGLLVKSCHAKKIRQLNLLFPQVPGLANDVLLRGIAEGLLLPNYQFTKLKHESLKDNEPILIETVTLLGLDPSYLDALNKYKNICEGVYFARDLVNGNADEITPQYLAHTALSLANSHPKLKATIFDKKRIEKEKMGLLLAVNRGSAIDPAFIILEYKGVAKPKDHTVLIGKGITFDTGGLNLKSSGMDLMKSDMAGAATTLAILKVAAELKLPLHLTAVIASTDNSISSTSYKPGDVYISYTGKTVEITNTDAEGRLVLADALSYAEKNLNPTRLINFATLTGGIDIALGSEAIGMMSNDDALSDSLIHAGSATFERVWRLPLFEEYKDSLRSDIADIKNYGSRSASSITAGIFMQQFISNKIPWAHFDIASTAYFSEAKRYHPKFATGIGVRLMIDFFQNNIEKF
jgi:leucyl aminopeptidase